MIGELYLSRHEFSNKYSINRLVLSRLSSKFCGQIAYPHKTSRYDLMLIKREIQKDPTSGQIRNNLSLNIKERTIRKRPVEAGLFSRRPAKKPFIFSQEQKSVT